MIASNNILTENRRTQWSEAFADLLGPDDWVIHSRARQEAATATFPSAGQIKGIAYPRSVEALRGCILLCNRYQLAFHVVSSGKNWGYGSASSLRDVSVLLHLQQLNRILDYQPELGVVTLEPGVRFSELRQFLLEQSAPWLIDAPGSTTEASVVGHTLERGFAQSQQCERHRSIIDLEVLLPNGKTIYSGMQAFAKCKVAGLHDAPIGPDFSSLFLQSNLGIVTKMTLQLQRRPRFQQQLFFCGSSTDPGENLHNLTNCLRELKTTEILGSSASLYNRARLLSTLENWPGKLGQQNWYGTSSLHSEHMPLLQAKRSVAQEAFAKYNLQLKVGALNQPNPHYGWSAPHNLKLAYGNRPMPQNPNPDLDQCGLIWVAPVLPFTGNAIQEASNIATEVLQQYQLEAKFSIHQLNARVAYLITPVIYDRSVAGADDNAMNCARQLTQQLCAAGYYP